MRGFIWRLIISVSLLAVVFITGCSTEEAGKQAGGQGDNLVRAGQEDLRDNNSGENQLNSASGTVEPASEDQSASQAGSKTTGQQDVTDSDKDLVIKSDNKVYAGAGQEAVNDLDREVDKLMESLNNLDSVEDSDLVVE